MPNRRFVSLIVAITAACLATTACSPGDAIREQSAAVRVDDATISRNRFEDQLDLVYENDDLRGYLFAGVTREQLRPDGAAVGTYTQQFVGAMAGLHVQFLVADEIISMCDATTRIDILNVLADLKARGLSILFITHDLSLGYYISQRTVILYRGAVVEMGATDKIFANPQHSYTRLLMAAVPRLDKKWAEVEAVLQAPRPELAAAGSHGGGRGAALVEVVPGHFVAR